MEKKRLLKLIKKCNNIFSRTNQPTILLTILFFSVFGILNVWYKIKKIILERYFMKLLEKVLVKTPVFGDIIKANIIAESIGVQTYSNWYLALGIIGLSPVVLVYRKLYKEAMITATISFILAPIFGYGVLAKIFNTLTTGLTIILFHYHVKKTILTSVGKTTEEKIEYVKNKLKPNLIGAIISAIIYLGILSFIGYFINLT